MEEVRVRTKRKNQILFAKDSAFLLELSDTIQAQKHRAVVLWAFESADETVKTLTGRYPNEKRFEAAVTAAKAWAAGKVKMPLARRAILQAHAAAKGMDNPEDIALCHAIGQACGTVHASGHAIGFPIYELTAIIRRYGMDECKEPVEKRMAHYMERLTYWSKNYLTCPCEWAGFMEE